MKEFWNFNYITEASSFVFFLYKQNPLNSFLIESFNVESNFIALYIFIISDIWGKQKAYEVDWIQDSSHNSTLSTKNLAYQGNFEV